MTISLSEVKPLHGKELIQEIENSIDQYIFFELMKNYSELIEQLKWLILLYVIFIQT